MIMSFKGQREREKSTNFKSHSPSLCSAFFTLKKADGQAFRTAELQKSAREFSHGLDLSP